jgi:hypothetical protein
MVAEVVEEAAVVEEAVVVVEAAAAEVVEAGGVPALSYRLVRAPLCVIEELATRGRVSAEGHVTARLERQQTTRVAGHVKPAKRGNGINRRARGV